MPVAVLLKSLIVWTGILVFAIANGALRQAILLPLLGSTAGLLVSGLLLSALVMAVAYLTLPWLGTRRRAHLVGIGAGWLALTVLFEFSFGLWQGEAWPVLLQAYTFEGGNIWPVVLVVIALAPCAAAKLRGWA